MSPYDAIKGKLKGRAGPMKAWLEKSKKFERVKWATEKLLRPTATSIASIVDPPVLWILNGHSSHAKSRELINLARETNAVLLCFPPHTTHRLQPHDVSFMAPFSDFYEQEVSKWLLNQLGRSVTIYQIGNLFNAAFFRAATVRTAVKGLKKTGICPFNRNVFPDHLFAPSDTTEQPLDNSHETPAVRRSTALPAELQPSTSSCTFAMVGPHRSRPISRSTAVEPLPSTPRSTSMEESQPTTPRPTTMEQSQLSTPQPSSSPYKAELVAEERERNTRKCVKKTALFKRANERANSKAKERKKRKVEEPAMTFEEEEEGEMDEACIFCNELFIHSEYKETWIQCSSCQGLAHEACSSAEEENYTFICDFCA
ncbi:hypothetical protein PR048_028451 [Dryococelus australis]|uniref:Zinc finger PHD-type domain-containing protein n=1 Tax=Dryococelus australis TaxID=614101 RepID=A0ABQ9GAL4_9NEOP|nr:hypothetical protein PR048_028451 [Dryococelus australis]